MIFSMHKENSTQKELQWVLFLVIKRFLGTKVSLIKIVVIVFPCSAYFFHFLEQLEI